MQDKQRRYLIYFLIVAAALVAYWEQLSYPLTDVDVQPLILTGQFDSMASLGSVLTEPLMKGRMPNALYWRPFTSITYGVDSLLWGLEPFGYHLTDLLFHLATGLLLFGFVNHLWSHLGRSGGRWIAATAAILFVLHPVHVENVPAIARRGDVLVGLFMVLTLVFLLQSLGRSTAWTSVAAAASCALGIGSKESGFAIPVIGMLFCICFYPTRDRAEWQRAITRGAPLVVLGAMMFALRRFVLRDIGGAEISTQGPIWWRLPHSAWLHLHGLLVPGSPKGQDFPGPSVLKMLASNVISAHPILVGLAAVGALGIVVLLVRKLDWSRSSHRILVFCLGSVGALFAVYSQVVFQTRYLYPAAVFFCILLAWVLWEAGTATLRSSSTPRRLASAAVSLAAGLLAITLLVGSPAFSHESLHEWRISAELSQQVLDEVEDHIATLAPGARVYLVNFPFRIERAVLPWSVMLLEHSVQGWLDLRFADKRLDVVGLSYLIFDHPVVDFDLRAAMRPTKELSVQLEGQGIATAFPWSTQFEEGRQGVLYEYIGPTRGKNLTIRILDPASEPEPLFLIWSFDRVETARGWNWQHGWPDL